MNDLPPEAAFMPIEAVEKRQRSQARRQQQPSVPRIGPRELGEADGVRDPATWTGAIPGRQWLVTGLIPLDQVTMITGNGGEGKSLIAAQLAASAVTGMSWLGHDVKQVKSAIVHCEDDEDEMKRRLNGILEPQGHSFGDLDDLILIDRDGKDDSLMYEAMNNDTLGRFTDFYARLEATVAKERIRLLVLDSLYNFFGGNENMRPQVTQFVGGLKRIAKTYGCAVVVIAHPGRAGMSQGGDGTSGSTAWHNAVRSRFYLHRRKHPSGDPDKKGPLVFEHMKANYGPKEGAIEIFYDRGRFVPTVDPPAPASEPQDDLPFDNSNFGSRHD